MRSSCAMPAVRPVQVMQRNAMQFMSARDEGRVTPRGRCRGVADGDAPSNDGDYHQTGKYDNYERVCVQKHYDIPSPMLFADSDFDTY
ncbi:MAG: hypothetical protein JWN03_6160 [Nocardia sp.]|nr:hypothetical protein [Nocardia sp.]